MHELVLVKRAEFDGVELDCYVKPKQKDKGDFWATREQIGRLLEYEEPMKAIAKIHERHSERLDKFSTIVKLTTVEGGREVAREVTVYNFKGLLEICRYSNQPKADAVMDCLWEVADEIRRTGAYVSDKALRNPEFIRGLAARLDAIEAENKELRERMDKDLGCTTLGKIVMSSTNAYTVQSAAQVLAQHGIPIGQNRLYQRFRKDKLLCSRKGKQYNKPTQKAIEQGLLGLQANTTGFSVVVMPKCLAKLADKLTEEYMPIVYLVDRTEALSAFALEG